jgi:hypothetical protein
MRQRDIIGGGLSDPLISWLSLPDNKSIWQGAGTF